MQLHALNNNKSSIAAKKAVKQQNYFCLECEGIVRVRAGAHRQAHFYHLNLAPTCRQNGKSMAHLQVQCHLEALISKESCQLERPFPEIGRIADLYWPEKQLVFEVQCSPISAEEVACRNKDYESLGLTVVWILHDNRYNRRRLSAAEDYLRGSLAYYTNINGEGRGIIYDQWDLCEKGVRHKTIKPFAVELNKPKQISFRKEQAHSFFQKRLKSWPLHFSGDLLDLFLSGARDARLEALFENTKANKTKINKTNKTLNQRLHQWLIRPYKLAFQLLLERACR